MGKFSSRLIAQILPLSSKYSCPLRKSTTNIVSRMAGAIADIPLQNRISGFPYTILRSWNSHFVHKCSGPSTIVFEISCTASLV